MRNWMQTPTGSNIDDRFSRFMHWATNAVWRLHYAETREDAHEQWDILLEMLNRARSSLLKDIPKSSHEFAKLRRWINEEPHLAYLMHARNSSAHRPDFEIETRTSTAFVDSDGQPAWFDARGARFVDGEGRAIKGKMVNRFHVKVKRVTDRGIVYDPPIEDAFFLAQQAIAALADFGEQV